MDWLDHMSPSPRSPQTKENVSTEDLSSNKTTAPKDTPAKDTSSKELPSALKSASAPAQKTMNKPKVDPFEYLGLKDDDDDAFEWMKPKHTETRPRTGEQRLAPVTPPQTSESRPSTGEQKLGPVTPQQTAPKMTEATPKVEQSMADQSPDDYLGLGGEVDLDSFLK